MKRAFPAKRTGPSVKTHGRGVRFHKTSGRHLRLQRPHPLRERAARWPTRSDPVKPSSSAQCEELRRVLVPILYYPDRMVSPSRYLTDRINGRLNGKRIVRELAKCPREPPHVHSTELTAEA